MGQLFDVMNLPEASSGEWTIKKFTITKEMESAYRFRAIVNGGRGMIYAGDYIKLYRDTTIVMSNSPDEMSDHLEFIYRAKGRVLIMGLGLGCALAEILDKPEVEEVTIIEKSEDVIKLVGWFYNDPRVNIIHADCLTWKPPKGKRYDVVWHDIWDTIGSDNYDEMKLLHRRFGRVCDWQSSWCLRTVKSMVKEGRDWGRSNYF